MQEAKKVESEREIERLRVEKEERRRKEDEERQRREDERRRKFEETRRRLEAETRRSEEELAAVQALREKENAEHDVKNMPSQLQSLKDVTESDLAEKLPPIVSRLQELTNANYINSEVMISTKLPRLLQDLYRRLPANELRDQAKSLYQQCRDIHEASVGNDTDGGTSMDVDQDERKRSANESPTKKPSDQNNANVSRVAKKRRHEKKKHAYNKAMDEETKLLHSDDGQLSKSAGFTIAPPFHPFDENREEPDLAIKPEWRKHVSKESPEKAGHLDTIVNYVRNHPDYVNDVARGCSIYVRGRLYLQLEPLSEETLCNWAHLIEINFCSMELEKKYELAKSHCEAYYDTATEEFYNSSGNVITNGSSLIRLPMVYYAISLDENDKVIVITGGKSMGASRFNDYATRNASQIPRSCDKDGKAPARIVLCFMALLTNLGGSSEAKNYPLKNLRNRSAEEIEAVGLMECAVMSDP